MTIKWNPIIPAGFLIEVDESFNFVSFIKQPPGNTKRFNEILAEHRASQTEPVRPQLTRAQILDRITAEYVRRNQIEEI